MQSTTPSNAVYTGLPGCIVASSDRLADVWPYSCRTFHTNIKKWGEIFPWEFPQYATREIEESFLRQHFSDVEIHMQGGAHGAGLGYKFLKQVWYTIAMFNIEKRIPAMEQWWWEQPYSKELLKDESTVELMLSPEATLSNFALDADAVELYGEKFLMWLMRAIQQSTWIWRQSENCKIDDITAVCAHKHDIADGNKASNSANGRDIDCHSQSSQEVLHQPIQTIASDTSRFIASGGSPSANLPPSSIQANGSTQPYVGNPNAHRHGSETFVRPAISSITDGRSRAQTSILPVHSTSVSHQYPLPRQEARTSHGTVPARQGSFGSASRHRWNPQPFNTPQDSGLAHHYAPRNVQNHSVPSEPPTCVPQVWKERTNQHVLPVSGSDDAVKQFHDAPNGRTTYWQGAGSRREGSFRGFDGNRSRGGRGRGRGRSRTGSDTTSIHSTGEVSRHESHSSRAPNYHGQFEHRTPNHFWRGPSGEYAATVDQRQHINLATRMPALTGNQQNTQQIRTYTTSSSTTKLEPTHIDPPHIPGSQSLNAERAMSSVNLPSIGGTPVVDPEYLCSRHHIGLQCTSIMELVVFVQPYHFAVDVESYLKGILFNVTNTHLYLKKYSAGNFQRMVFVTFKSRKDAAQALGRTDLRWHDQSPLEIQVPAKYWKYSHPGYASHHHSNAELAMLRSQPFVLNDFPNRTGGGSYKHARSKDKIAGFEEPIVTNPFPNSPFERQTSSSNEDSGPAGANSGGGTLKKKRKPNRPKKAKPGNSSDRGAATGIIPPPKAVLSNKSAAKVPESQEVRNLQQKTKPAKQAAHLVVGDNAKPRQQPVSNARSLEAPEVSASKKVDSQKSEVPTSVAIEVEEQKELNMLADLQIQAEVAHDDVPPVPKDSNATAAAEATVAVEEAKSSLINGSSPSIINGSEAVRSTERTISTPSKSDPDQIDDSFHTASGSPTETRTVQNQHKTRESCNPASKVAGDKPKIEQLANPAIKVAATEQETAKAMEAEETQNAPQQALASTKDSEPVALPQVPSSKASTTKLRLVPHSSTFKGAQRSSSDSSSGLATSAFTTAPNTPAVTLDLAETKEVEEKALQVPTASGSDITPETGLDPISNSVAAEPPAVNSAKKSTATAESAERKSPKSSHKKNRKASEKENRTEGPAQTESLHPFGQLKQQKKTNKDKKSKSTLKGKPICLEKSSSRVPSSETTNNDGQVPMLGQPSTSKDSPESSGKSSLVRTVLDCIFRSDSQVELPNDVVEGATSRAGHSKSATAELVDVASKEDNAAFLEAKGTQFKEQSDNSASNLNLASDDTNKLDEKVKTSSGVAGGDLLINTANAEHQTIPATADSQKLSTTKKKNKKKGGAKRRSLTSSNSDTTSLTEQPVQVAPLSKRQSDVQKAPEMPEKATGTAHEKSEIQSSASSSTLGRHSTSPERLSQSTETTPHRRLPKHSATAHLVEAKSPTWKKTRRNANMRSYNSDTIGRRNALNIFLSTSNSELAKDGIPTPEDNSVERSSNIVGGADVQSQQGHSDTTDDVESLERSPVYTPEESEEDIEEQTVQNSPNPTRDIVFTDAGPYIIETNFEGGRVVSRRYNLPQSGD